MRIKAMGDVLVKTEWVSEDVPKQPPQTAVLANACEQIEAYWSKQCVLFSLPLLLQGTAFQQKVWRQLAQLVFADTLSYMDFAKLLGSGARAIGGACKRNPYPLIIPCHRIVARNGLGGYAGRTEGEQMMIKRRLLMHEGFCCKAG